MENNNLSGVAELVREIQLGRMIILMDDENRENEGDLVLAGQFADPEKINFMARNACGLICLALSYDHAAQMKLPLMVPEKSNRSPNRTSFLVSIEASSGVTTGISAYDRAVTIRRAAQANVLPQDIIMPGHVFPIRASKGGVLERPGHTEGSVELVQLAGLVPAAAICEVMNPDGSMARLPELLKFAQRYQMKVGTIQSVLDYVRNCNVNTSNTPLKYHPAEVRQR